MFFSSHALADASVCDCSADSSFVRNYSAVWELLGLSQKPFFNSKFYSLLHLTLGVNAVCCCLPGCYTQIITLDLQSFSLQLQITDFGFPDQIQRLFF